MILWVDKIFDRSFPTSSPCKEVAKFSCRTAGTPLSYCAYLKKCHYQSLQLHCWPRLQGNFDKINEQVCLTAEANSVSILSGCFPELLLPCQFSNSACWRCSTASPSFFGLVWSSWADRAQVLLYPFSQDSWGDVEDLIPSGSRLEVLK